MEKRRASESNRFASEKDENRVPKSKTCTFEKPDWYKIAKSKTLNLTKLWDRGLNFRVGSDDSIPLFFVVSDQLPVDF